MRRTWHTSIFLALIGLVAGILACNAPTPTSQVPSPNATPEMLPSEPPQESPLGSPTEAPPEATSTPVPPATTEAAPTSTETTPPPATTPRPTPPASGGPLDFPVPARLDSWRHLSDGRQEATIILRITGGAPPYTIHHDLDVFTTWETSPAIVFEAQGCSALVHTIIVESADGQSVKKEYYIPVPWCG
jgi:hypothetical protein